MVLPRHSTETIVGSTFLAYNSYHYSTVGTSENKFGEAQEEDQRRLCKGRSNERKNEYTLLAGSEAFYLPAKRTSEQGEKSREKREPNQEKEERASASFCLALQ